MNGQLYVAVRELEEAAGTNVSFGYIKDAATPHQSAHVVLHLSEVFEEAEDAIVAIDYVLHEWIRLSLYGEVSERFVDSEMGHSKETVHYSVTENLLTIKGAFKGLRDVLDASKLFIVRQRFGADLPGQCGGADLPGRACMLFYRYNVLARHIDEMTWTVGQV